MESVDVAVGGRGIRGEMAVDVGPWRQISDGWSSSHVCMSAMQQRQRNSLANRAAFRAILCSLRTRRWLRDLRFQEGRVLVRSQAPMPYGEKGLERGRLIADKPI